MENFRAFDNFSNAELSFLIYHVTNAFSMGNMATYKRRRSDVTSYAELNDIQIPQYATRRRLLQPKASTVSWKEGFYPVQITNEDDEHVRVHYIGWDKRYDETKARDELVSIPHGIPQAQDGILNHLAICIKEKLTGYTRKDSSVTITLPLYSAVDGENILQLQHASTLNKIYKDISVYCITSRDQLIPLLGSTWDYRILNSSCDNYYVKTETVKFFVRQKSSLVDLCLYPDHTLEHHLVRGKELRFSFIVCPGNLSDAHKLLNESCL